MRDGIRFAIQQGIDVGCYFPWSGGSRLVVEQDDADLVLLNP